MTWRGLAALAVALGLAAAPAVAADAPTLYRGATLIDVVAGAARPDMAILVDGEKIVSVAPAATLAPPAGARIVDVHGLYVSPGLVNSHEHLATPPDRPFAEAMLRRDVYGGITTVRDMADDLRALADISRASLVGEIAAPDIYYAALMAGPEFFDDPRTHETTRGAVAGAVPWMQAITHDTNLPLAVARAQGTGATGVKIYADLPADLIIGITREAHRQGMMVWAHAAVFPARPKADLDAGVDTVSHVCMLAYQASDVMPRAYAHRAPVDAAKFAGPGDNPVVQALYDQMRAQGTILDATVWIYQELAEEHAAHPDGPAPYCSLDLAVRLANQAWRSHVLFSTGTDGFSPQADLWPALDDEMALLQDKVGMPPAAVLRSATLTGAMTMGLQGQIGTIEPGKLANLAFTRDNPLAGVQAFRTVVLTVKRGRDYWRKDYRPVTPAEMTGEE